MDVDEYVYSMYIYIYIICMYIICGVPKMRVAPKHPIFSMGFSILNEASSYWCVCFWPVEPKKLVDRAWIAQEHKELARGAQLQCHVLGSRELSHTLW